MKKKIGIVVIIVLALVMIFFIVKIIVFFHNKKENKKWYLEKYKLTQTTTEDVDEKLNQMESRLEEKIDALMEQQNQPEAETTEATEVTEAETTEEIKAEETTEEQLQPIPEAAADTTIVLPYGTETYKIGFDCEIINISEYVSESNGYIIRRPYDGEFNDTYCPEDMVLIRENGKFKLIIFQGFGEYPQN